MKEVGSEPATPKKIRAFIALKAPPRWEEELAAFQEKLKAKLRTKAIRWTKAEQIHITLRFFGWILPNEADEIAQILPGICSLHESFTLRCEGLGCFPNVRRPRVLWAGLSGELDGATRLQAAITQATRNFGEPPEERAFTPHLTLARIQNLERSNVEQLEASVARGFKIESEWIVKEMVLMRSHLSPQGSTYEAIAKCPLS